MEYPRKISPIISQIPYGGIFNIQTKKEYKMGDPYIDHGQRIGTVIRNTGLVGSLWGTDLVVSQQVPKIKRKYKKIIGEYITYRSLKYRVAARQNNKYICNCGYNSILPQYKEFTYYKIKKLL